MKLSKWTIVGLLAGAVFAVGSFVRYYVIWIDLDKAITYPIIGLLIMAVSWLYNENLKANNELTAIGDFIAERFRK